VVRDTEVESSNSFETQSISPNPEGIFQWIRILKDISDEDLKVIAGTDAALFILFNRYAAIFFMFVTVFNALVFLPMYLTGHPKDQKDVIDTEKNVIILALLTSINISGSPAKQVAVFVLMMSIYTLGAFCLMYFYWKKSMEWRYRKHSHQDAFLDGE
jgi:hypothetical protein